MNTIYWLGIGYGVVFFGIGAYLAFLGLQQKRLIQKLEELKEQNNEY